MGNKSTNDSYPLYLTNKRTRTGQPVENFPYKVDVVRTMNRVASDNPAFQALISAGKNATNGMIVTAVNTKFTQGSDWKSKHRDAYGRSYDCVSQFKGLYPQNLSVSDFSASVLHRAQQDAASAHFKKMRQKSESFSGMTFLAEFRETLHMLRNPAQSLFNYSKVSKVNFDIRKRALMNNKRISRQRKQQELRKLVASSHLEWSFGAMPLLNDINTVANAALMVADAPRIVHVISRGKADGSVSGFFTNGMAPALSSVRFETSTRNQVEVLYDTAMYDKITVNSGVASSIGSYFGIDPKDLIGYQQAFEKYGFTTQNIIPAMWEGAPWSFLFDYFGNIGEVLNASTLNTSGIVYTRVVTRERVQKHVHNGIQTLGPTEEAQNVFEAPSCVTTLKRITRTTGGVPFPELHFSLPGRTSQFLNLAALGTLFLT